MCLTFYLGKCSQGKHFRFVELLQSLHTENESGLLLDYVGGISTLPWCDNSLPAAAACILKYFPFSVWFSKERHQTLLLVFCRDTKVE